MKLSDVQVYDFTTKLSTWYLYFGFPENNFCQKYLEIDGLEEN